MAEVTYNTLGDIKYKIFLRGMNEFEWTNFAVEEDNPRGLSATEINNFKAYRTAWAALMDDPPVNPTPDRDKLGEWTWYGIDVPDFPEGWSVHTRVDGDLPPVICRDNELDGEYISMPQRRRRYNGFFR